MCVECGGNYAGLWRDHIAVVHDRPPVLKLAPIPARAPRSFTFTVRPLPKTSELSGNARQHWTGTSKSAEVYRQLTAAGIREACGHESTPRFYGRVRLHVCFMLASERIDWDNLIAATKPAIDAIKNMHILTDDAIAVIQRFTVEHQIVPVRDMGIRFTITEWIDP